MADTFTLYASAIALTATKSLCAVFNGSGSGVVLRIKRVQVLNTQIAAATGVIGQMEVRAITSNSSGTAIVPTKHHPTQASLPAQVVMNTNGTVVNATNSVIYRQGWSSDEPAVGGATMDEWQGIPAWNTFFESVGDSLIQGFVLREGEGLSVTTASNLTAGTADVRIEFVKV
jgi:hypothetical protein